MIKIILNSALFIILLTVNASAKQLDQNSVRQFIDRVSTRHAFDYKYLQSIFEQTNYSQRVIDAISRPAEALPWYKYREIFIQADRINQGVKFWKLHEQTLQQAEQQYGVPAEIIVAIIGVETLYGKFKGKDRVMDALSTLSFHYPKRSKFFIGELEQFLLLTREQNIDPLSINGSYAGAMGIPQFIPSSYRNYAADFDGDQFIDIWNNPIDAIGSVANYFRAHGWQQDKIIVVPTRISGNQYMSIPDNGLIPDLQIDQVRAYGIEPLESIPDQAKLKVMVFENYEGEEIWLGLENFYVITRYNHSKLYALAVYQLAEKIKKEFQSVSSVKN